MNIILLIAIIGFLLLVILGLSIVNFSSQNMINLYNEYDKIRDVFFGTVDFAKNVSLNEFSGQINVNIIDGLLTDNYCNGTISLSQKVATTPSLSSFSICAHELGHAMQYRDNKPKMIKFQKQRIRSALFGKLVTPCFLIGIVCFFFNTIAAIAFASFGFLFFIAGLFLKLATIKIETEASQNALLLLKKYAEFDKEHLLFAKKFLNSAKLTYVASFLKSILKWTMLTNKHNWVK